MIELKYTIMLKSPYIIIRLNLIDSRGVTKCLK